MLLHIEELQMQKDIRNCDMKGVVFQQERGDRRFLILEVSHRLGTSVVTESSSLYSYSCWKPGPFTESIHNRFWCKLFDSGLRDLARYESNKLLNPRYTYTL